MRKKLPNYERSFYYNLLKCIGYSTQQAVRIRDFSENKILLIIKNTGEAEKPLINI